MRGVEDNQKEMPSGWCCWQDTGTMGKLCLLVAFGNGILISLCTPYSHQFNTIILQFYLMEQMFQSLLLVETVQLI